MRTIKVIDNAYIHAMALLSSSKEVYKHRHRG